MAQTEITGSDQPVSSVQPGSPVLPLKSSADRTAFVHPHVEEPSHLLENGFETAEAPVPDDPGNIGFSSHAPLQTQPAPLEQELGMQQNGFSSSEHVVATSFPDENGGTTEGTSGSASSAAEEPEVKLDAGPAKDMNLPVNRRMWFVRVPRPAEDPNVRLLEREMESYKAQVRLLNESLAVKRVEKEGAKESTQSAWDNLNACKGQVNSKQAALEPLRGARDARNNANKEFRSAFGDLDVRSEEELDARLAAMRHTIEHESIPLTEEKRLMKAMSTLSGQRERVRKYAAAHASIGSTKEDADRNHASLKELEAENRALWEEKKLASSILTKYKDEEKVVDDALRDIFTERRRIKELQDDVWGRLQETRRVQRAKLDDFYNNRRMSQVVRGMIKESRVEEARGLCRQQTEEKLGQLGADEAYRRHYNLLWQQQRNQPISLGGNCDLGTGYVEPSLDMPAPTPSKATKGNSATGAAREALSSIGGKVASTLNEAASSIKGTMQMDSAPPVSKPPASQPAGSLPKSSPQKAAASPAKPAASLPNGTANGVAPIGFVLPAAATRSAEPEMSEEELKAKVREQNRIAAEEAEARKERRRRDQEKKKAKALTKRQQQEAAEKQRQDAEAAAAAAKAAEPDSAEDAAEEAAASAPAAAQEDASLQPTFGRAGKVRPRSKRSNYDIKAIWRQWSTQIMAVLAVVVALVMINVCYTLFGATAA
ncbi:hypothetical protein WJX74_009109 [Apatococcus lobatus]|uniref:Uncharacterized protein n=1 Tax=Apatococcus lobatus TaxID=904363 RepID=A0AAW1SES1_9CHLO